MIPVDDYLAYGTLAPKQMGQIKLCSCCVKHVTIHATLIIRCMVMKHTASHRLI